MTKQASRQETLARLKALAVNSQLKQAKESHLSSKLLASDLWQEASTIGVTLSLPVELNTEPIIQQAWEEGKKVAVPKVTGKGQMSFVTLTPSSCFSTTAFGVREPINGELVKKTELDLIIVPGVSFRQDGYRIGFGGGYYDRYLTDYRGRTCSLVFNEQVSESWEAASYDVAVERLFTES